MLALALNGSTQSCAHVRPQGLYARLSFLSLDHSCCCQTPPGCRRDAVTPLALTRDVERRAGRQQHAGQGRDREQPPPHPLRAHVVNGLEPRRRGTGLVARGDDDALQRRRPRRIAVEAAASQAAAGGGAAAGERALLQAATVTPSCGRQVGRRLGVPAPEAAAKCTGRQQWLGLVAGRARRTGRRRPEAGRGHALDVIVRDAHIAGSARILRVPAMAGAAGLHGMKRQDVGGSCGRQPTQQVVVQSGKGVPMGARLCMTGESMGSLVTV